MSSYALAWQSFAWLCWIWNSTMVVRPATSWVGIKAWLCAISEGRHSRVRSHLELTSGFESSPEQCASFGHSLVENNLSARIPQSLHCGVRAEFHYCIRDGFLSLNWMTDNLIHCLGPHGQVAGDTINRIYRMRDQPSGELYGSHCATDNSSA